MNQYAILTAIGADRPGIVDEVSEFIFDRGGNIEMTIDEDGLHPR